MQRGLAGRAAPELLYTRRQGVPQVRAVVTACYRAEGRSGIVLQRSIYGKNAMKSRDRAPGSEFEIVSVNVARPSVLLKWPTGDVISSIDKRPVAADSLELTTLNLEGDAQADTRPTTGGGQVHGGPHQAVYAYPAEHYARLEELLGRSLWWGFMGENVTVRGGTEDDVRIGDLWRWGTALLQVSAPRGPCYKLGIRLGRQAMRTVIREEALVGWYLRVLTPGRILTSGTISLEERHPAGVTVARVQAAINDRSNTYLDLAGLEPLSPGVRRALAVRDRDIFGGVPELDEPA
jgi:MOSC domain-containing protein YiiM